MIITIILTIVLVVAVVLVSVFAFFMLDRIGNSEATKQKHNMFTKEMIQNAASKYRNNLNYNVDIESLDSMYLEDIDTLVEDAFIDGCLYILANLQKN